MTTVRVMKNNETVYEVSFDSFRKAQKHFDKVVCEYTNNTERRHSINSVEEAYADRVMLMRGRLTDTFVMI